MYTLGNLTAALLLLAQEKSTSTPLSAKKPDIVSLQGTMEAHKGRQPRDHVLPQGPEQRLELLLCSILYRENLIRGHIIHTQCPQTPSGHSFLMAPPLILKTHGFDVATMMFSHVIHELVPPQSPPALPFTSLPDAQPRINSSRLLKKATCF